METSVWGGDEVFEEVPWLRFEWLFVAACSTNLFFSFLMPASNVSVSATCYSLGHHGKEKESKRRILQHRVVKIAIRSQRNGRAAPDLPQHTLLEPCQLNSGRNGVGILRHVDGVYCFLAESEEEDINFRDDG